MLWTTAPRPPGRRGPGPHAELTKPPDLYFELRGAGNAVVLLHGQPGRAGDWRAVADDLARDHTVVTLDRPGYGRSHGRAGGFATNARAVAGLLEGLQVGKAVVVGHSWAGGVALRMAIDYPDAVSGLVLVCSVVPGEPLGRLDRLLARPLVGTALAALTLSTAGRLLAWGPARAFAGWRLRGQIRQELAEMARSWRSRPTWHSFAIEQRALVHELPVLAAQLPSVGVPTTVVAGSTDRIVPLRASRGLAAAIPGASLEEVRGGGHLLPQLHPEAVTGAVRRLTARSRR